MALSSEQLSEIKSYMDARAEGWAIEAAQAGREASQAEFKATEERRAARTRTIAAIIAALVVVSGAGLAQYLSVIAAGEAQDAVDAKWAEANREETFFETTVKTIIDAQTEAQKAQDQAERFQKSAQGNLNAAQDLLKKLQNAEADLEARASAQDTALEASQKQQEEIEAQLAKLRDEARTTEELLQDVKAKRGELAALTGTLTEARILARELEALGDTASEIVRNAVKSPEVISSIRAAASIPENVVVASFERCRNLAGGWSEVIEARGRVILGANSAGTHGFEFREFGSTGGEEKHKLTIEEMPRHNHGGITGRDIVAPQGTSLWINTHRPDERYMLEKGGAAAGQTDGKHHHSIAPEGSGIPHNNMPPYLALYFCKKN